MPHLYTSGVSTGAGFSGSVYTRNDGQTVLNAIALPTGVTGMNRKAAIVSKYGRLYIIGQFSRMLVYNEYGQLHEGGIRAPNTVPTLVAGSFSGGSTGNAIGYIALGHKQGDKVLQESNLSRPSATLSLSGTGRGWGNISATSVDSRVNTVFGYLSVDGSIPALCWERPLGVTAVTENVLTGSLTRVAAARVGLDGVAEFDTYARGVPPYCLYGEFYHDTLFLGGDPAYPERIYYSKIFEPESFNTVATVNPVNGRLDKPWLETLDGEPVTGLKRHGDELIVGCEGALYAIQGYGTRDYSVRRVSKFYDVISHFSMVLCGENSDLWAAGQEGVWMYNGQFRYLMKNLHDYWRDAYLANKAGFEQCYAAEDRFQGGYKLLIPKSGGPSFYFYGDYEAVDEGGQPYWTFDQRDREDTVLANLPDKAGEQRQDLHTGSSEGFVRKENIPTDPADDNDTFQKKADVTFPHAFIGDQGGDEAHGRTFNGLDLFAVHSSNLITVSLYAGDDDARSALAPQWSDTSLATAAPAGSRALVSQTSEHFVPENVSGKGATLRVEVIAPLGVEIRGYGLYFTPGPQVRAFSG